MEQQMHADGWQNVYLSHFGFLYFFMPVLLLTSACSGKTDQYPPRASPPSIEAHSTLPAEEDPHWPASFGFGRPALTGEIARLDIDIRPDGTGLPPGAGNALQGRILYAEKCAACHGLNGTEGPNDVLVGPAVAEASPFGLDLSRKKTIGNYWPYATTVFDYIRRAMPYNAPGSLTDDEVYSITAFLLHANKIIDSADVMDAHSLPAIAMPARDLFVTDDRQKGTTVR